MEYVSRRHYFEPVGQVYYLFIKRLGGATSYALNTIVLVLSGCLPSQLLKNRGHGNMN